MENENGEESPRADSEPLSRRFLLSRGAAASAVVFSIAGCTDTTNQAKSPPAATGTRSSSLTPSNRSSPTHTETTTRSPSDTPTETAEGTATETAEDTPTETAEETPSPDSTDEDNWYVRPSSANRHTPGELRCENTDGERFDQRFKERNLVYGDSGPWKLRVDTLSASYGDEVIIRLTNTSKEQQNRSSDGDINIQVKTGAGWQEVRVATRPSEQATTDEVNQMDPGDSHDWTLKMTDESLPEVYNGQGEVCPHLKTGRYRFVFAGIDGAIGVAFDFRTS